MLLDPNTSDSDKHTIESYMASTFTISDFIKAKKIYPDHPVFSSRFFFNKLAQATLNREIKAIGDNIVQGPDLNEKLEASRNRLLGFDFVDLFNLDRGISVYSRPTQFHLFETLC